MDLSVFKISIGNYTREGYDKYNCENELPFSKH